MILPVDSHQMVSRRETVARNGLRSLATSRLNRWGIEPAACQICGPDRQLKAVATSIILWHPRIVGWDAEHWVNPLHRRCLLSHLQYGLVLPAPIRIEFLNECGGHLAPWFRLKHVKICSTCILAPPVRGQRDCRSCLEAYMDRVAAACL